MKGLSFLWSGVLVMLVAGGPAHSQYFYSGGATVPLYVDSTRVLICFDEQFGGQDQTSLLASISRIDSVASDDHVTDGFIACALAVSAGYAQFLDSVQAIEGVYRVEPYYVNDLDSSFLVGLSFCVAFDESVTSTEIDSINALFRVVIDHEITGLPNVFVLRNTDSSNHGLLDLANAYHELPGVRYSHPDFGFWITPQSYRLFDHYSGWQPHVKKVVGSFNDRSVWDFAGLDDTVVVAVLDDGVTSHEDLPASRVLSGYDFADGDFNPAPGTLRYHGMACAGIVGASHTTDSTSGLLTSSGVISLNPRTLIKPVKIFNNLGSVRRSSLARWQAQLGTHTQPVQTSSPIVGPTT
jgi:hypothetical protein